MVKRKIIPLAVIMMLLAGCGNKEISQNPQEENKAPITTPEFTTDDALSLFSIDEDIPENVLETMIGKSLPNREFAEELSFLTVSYIDFDGETQVGNLVVNKEVAKEVLDIFKDIYKAEFPIEKMELVDMYDADDNKSMLANNTSAFNYRTIAGTSTISNHGKGLAIDINPFINPHVINGKANPSEAQDYADRSGDTAGLIKEGGAVYEAFTSRGWSWGGHWDNPDYQHFEKVIN